MLDATGDDEAVWPVSYKIGDGEWVYTGPETEEPEPANVSRYGIVGNMTGWGNDADYAMYEVEAGVYVGKTAELPAGDYQFKVRADSDWADSFLMKLLLSQLCLMQQVMTKQFGL